MATEATLEKPLNDAHPPNEHAFQLFDNCAATIRHELIKLRHHWDKHEPRMFSRAGSILDQDLGHFNINEDLTLIRAGMTSYGSVVFGKIRLPAVRDDEGEGFIHVRLHDPPGEGNQDAIFHSILTDEIKDTDTGHITSYKAIMRKEDPLVWFNE
ncbi:hypothetical protein PSTG_03364 [Puccinia striiformis f. sp. tritici PST-78]|uniref:Uncharacterized protein n=1 Tax=Puccinia striiformis f. sp. tritici PST-78 TaxID=1165861 RepID=A0A0L0VVX1_9BASI|nr:hypothetical protein PSTG_03364 [Puccinia striiformis f. sp. tritici PST-78]